MSEDAPTAPVDDAPSEPEGEGELSFGRVFLSTVAGEVAAAIGIIGGWVLGALLDNLLGNPLGGGGGFLPELGPLPFYGAGGLLVTLTPLSLWFTHRALGGKGSLWVVPPCLLISAIPAFLHCTSMGAVQSPFWLLCPLIAAIGLELHHLRR